MDKALQRLVAADKRRRIDREPLGLTGFGVQLERDFAALHAVILAQFIKAQSWKTQINQALTLYLKLSYISF